MLAPAFFVAAHSVYAKLSTPIILSAPSDQTQAFFFDVHLVDVEDLHQAHVAGVGSRGRLEDIHRHQAHSVHQGESETAGSFALAFVSGLPI